MEIDLLWTAVITELKFMRLSVRTEMTEVTEIVKVIMMVLASEKWLLEMMTVLGLAGTALAAVMI